MIYTEAKENAIAELNSRQMIHAKQAKAEIEVFFSTIVKLLTRLSQSDHIIDLDEPIKALGVYDVPIKVTEELQPSIKLYVIKA